MGPYYRDRVPIFSMLTIFTQCNAESAWIQQWVNMVCLWWVISCMLSYILLFWGTQILIFTVKFHKCLFWVPPCSVLERRRIASRILCRQCFSVFGIYLLFSILMTVTIQKNFNFGSPLYVVKVPFLRRQGPHFVQNWVPFWFGNSGGSKCPMYTFYIVVSGLLVNQ